MGPVNRRQAVPAFQPPVKNHPRLKQRFRFQDNGMGLLKTGFLMAKFLFTRIFLLSGMAFFSSSIETLKTLVIALGAGLGVWGVINLLEGYGNDNPGAKSQGMKQLMAGGGVALIGMQLIPLLANLFS